MNGMMICSNKNNCDRDQCPHYKPHVLFQEYDNFSSCIDGKCDLTPVSCCAEEIFEDFEDFITEEEMEI